MLWQAADVIEAHADELAELETPDQGQPLPIARNVSVAGTAEHFRYSGRSPRLPPTAS
jgi:aldehyde dehydrogenase (NAD+)/betaine-aldehyde dehydrogenase